MMRCGQHDSGKHPFPRGHRHSPSAEGPSTRATGESEGCGVRLCVCSRVRVCTCEFMCASARDMGACAYTYMCTQGQGATFRRAARWPGQHLQTRVIGQVLAPRP